MKRLGISILLLSAPLVAAPTLQVLTVSKSFEAELRPGGTGIKFKTAQGEQPVSFDALVEMRIEQYPVEDFFSNGVFFTNGDRLSAKVMSLEQDKLSIESDLFGRVAVPVGFMNSVELRGGGETRPASSRRTYLRLANGDSLPGTLRWLDHSSIGLKSSLGLVNVERVRVVGITFDNKAAPVAPGVNAIVRFRSGDRMTGSWKEFKEGQIHLSTASIGDVRFPLESVSAILFTGGKTTFLSDLKPARYTSRTFVPDGVEREYGVDANGAGGPLSVGERTYAKGLVMYSESELTYELGGAYKSLDTIVNLEDAAKYLASGGAAVCAIIVDGKRKFEHTVTRKSPPHAVKIDVVGARELKLRVEFGGDGDAGDRVSWLMARLVK